MEHKLGYQRSVRTAIPLTDLIHLLRFATARRSIKEHSPNLQEMKSRPDISQSNNNITLLFGLQMDSVLT